MLNYSSTVFGEVSEWFKELVLKTSDSERGRGFESHLLRLYRVYQSAEFGEVPKWLKGLPWKGSRSLIAARGFKSLLLRLTIPDGRSKKAVDKSRKMC